MEMRGVGPVWNAKCSKQGSSALLTGQIAESGLSQHMQLTYSFMRINTFRNLYRADHFTYVVKRGISIERLQ